MKKLLLLLALISFPALAANKAVTSFSTATGSDKICGWDDSASKGICFTLGTGLSTSGTTLNGTVTQYTDEMAQDAIGAMVDSTLVYVDGTPLLTRGAITGDISIPQASNASTLATVNSNVGSFGSATQTGTFTVNGKGLLTAAGNTTVTPAVGSITGLGTGVATFLATPSSANLSSAITDETGSGGVAVFASSPTITTPSFTTGFKIGGAAAAGAFPRGNGTNYIASGTTIPDTGTSGGILGYTASGTLASSSALTANAVVVGGGAGATPTSTGVTIDSNNLISGYKGNINAQTGTTYTLVAGDTGKIVEISNGSAITVTLPNNLAQGFTCRIVQTGAGQITLSPAGGATLNNHSSFTKTSGQWAEVDVYITTNSGGTSAVYIMAGDGA